MNDIIEKLENAIKLIEQLQISGSNNALILFFAEKNCSEAIELLQNQNGDE